MTVKEIKEGHRLIWDFLGEEFIQREIAPMLGHHYPSLDELKFSGSWEWLMKVVDVISDYEAVGDFEIGNSYVQILGSMESDETINDILIDHSGGDDKKRAVFEACVKLIKQIK